MKSVNLLIISDKSKFEEDVNLLLLNNSVFTKLFLFIGYTNKHKLLFLIILYTLT